MAFKPFDYELMSQAAHLWSMDNENLPWWWMFGMNYNDLTLQLDLPLVKGHSLELSGVNWGVHPAIRKYLPETSSFPAYDNQYEGEDLKARGVAFQHLLDHYVIQKHLYAEGKKKQQLMMLWEILVWEIEFCRTH